LNKLNLFTLGEDDEDLYESDSNDESIDLCNNDSDKTESKLCLPADSTMKVEDIG